MIDPDVPCTDDHRGLNLDVDPAYRLHQLMHAHDQLITSYDAMAGKLAEVKAWLATYPPIPFDVTGDPEAVIVARLRRMLGEAQ